MKTVRFLMLVVFILLTGNVVTNSMERGTEGISNAEAVQSETLMIYLSNEIGSSGHKEAVVQVLQYSSTPDLASLPTGNYTYEWTLTPGGGVTSCNMYYPNARRGDVVVNYNTSSSSRVEFECKVYLNSSLYTILRYYWYLN